MKRKFKSLREMQNRISELQNNGVLLENEMKKNWNELKEKLTNNTAGNVRSMLGSFLKTVLLEKAGDWFIKFVNKYKGSGNNS